MRKLLTFILAGGRGERLDPLTKDRAKPAVPFGGNYRIIDFTLSNCVNSGLRRIYILTQYKSFSLQKHLLSGWDVVSNQLGEFIDVIPAQQRINAEWYRGTADAIYQNLYAIRDCDPKYILILAGDHIYKMNYAHMITDCKERDADVMVACVPMPKETSKDFGVIEVDEENNVCGFQEKPDTPKVIPGDVEKISASMGIYLFKRDALLDALEKDAANLDSNHDFGKNIIPQMLNEKKRVCAYNFSDSNNQPSYWRDIGTRDAYYQANLDLLGPNPEFDLYDKTWPVRTFHEQYPPNKIVSTESGNGTIINSMLSGGCVVAGGHVENSVLSSNVKVKEGAEVRSSVLMDGVVIEAGARIKNVIVDKEVVIPSNMTIGYDLEQDKKRFVLTASGVVIVPKRTSMECES